jgi:hypothetical protein
MSSTRHSRTWSSMKYGNVHFTHVTLGPSSLLGQHDISTGQNCFLEHNGVLRRALPGRATSWGQGAIHGIHGGGGRGDQRGRCLGSRPTRPCHTWLCSGKWVRLAAGGERVVIYSPLVGVNAGRGPLRRPAPGESPAMYRNDYNAVSGPSGAPDCHDSFVSRCRSALVPLLAARAKRFGPASFLSGDGRRFS